MALALFSTAMISSCVGNIIISKMTSTAGTKIYGYLFKKNSNIANISLDHIIKELDIKEKIKICNIFIETIHDKHPELDSKLLSLKDIIIEIEGLLDIIEKKKQKHNNKYFTYYRTLHLTKEKENLLIYDKIISKRLDYLIKILSLNINNK